MKSERIDSENSSNDLPTGNKKEIDFTPLFFPKTMAVIGASKNPVGALKYVRAHKDTPIKVFPVNINPELDELEGLKVHRSVEEIGQEIDLAIIGVPKQHVPAVIRGFKDTVVKFAVIFTSGFSESGNDDLQVSLEEAIASVPTRFIGPNCLGIYNPRARLVYFPGYPCDETNGNIAFISQSGGHTAKTNTYLMSHGANFSRTISIGNCIDLKPRDFLPYFKQDPDTCVIGFYLESTSDGRALMKSLRDVTREKPVIIWKGGRGKVGVQATASHTGKLAGNYKMWEVMCKQTGTMLASDFDVFAGLLTMFSFNIPVPVSNRVALVACGGGNAVEAADFFETKGFKIPELGEETKEKIYKFIPDVNTSLRNPVDLGEYGYVPKRFGNALKAICTDENIDAVVYIKESMRFPVFAANFFMTPEQYEREMVRKIARAHKFNAEHRNIPMYLNDPLLAESLDGFGSRIRFMEGLAKKGIPTFTRIDVLVRAIQHALDYKAYLDSKP